MFTRNHEGYCLPLLRTKIVRLQVTGETLPQIGEKPSFGYMSQYEWTGESYEARPDLGGKPAHAWHDDLISHAEWRDMLLELHAKMNSAADAGPGVDKNQSSATFESLQLQLQEVI